MNLTETKKQIQEWFIRINSSTQKDINSLNLSIQTAKKFWLITWGPEINWTHYYLFEEFNKIIRVRQELESTAISKRNKSLHLPSFLAWLQFTVVFHWFWFESDCPRHRHSQEAQVLISPDRQLLCDARSAAKRCPDLLGVRTRQCWAAAIHFEKVNAPIF